jgi:hypothetical protein
MLRAILAEKGILSEPLSVHLLRQLLTTIRPLQLPSGWRQLITSAPHGLENDQT